MLAVAAAVDTPALSSKPLFNVQIRMKYSISAYRFQYG
jgi:hypothetical protein